MRPNDQSCIRLPCAETISSDFDQAIGIMPAVHNLKPKRRQLFMRPLIEMRFVGIAVDRAVLRTGANRYCQEDRRPGGPEVFDEL